MGWSVGRHVDHPCGGQISPWPARKENNVYQKTRRCFEEENKGALRQSFGRMLVIGVAEVMLVSGRCCCQIFDLSEEGSTEVLEECARLLGLDKGEVLESAVLLHGTRAIGDRWEGLEAGKIHEVTLVMDDR